MKDSICTLLLIVIAFSINAQNIIKDDVSKIEISGSVESKDIDKIIFYPCEYLAEDVSLLQEIKVDSKGKLKFHYSLKKPMGALLMLGDSKYMIFMEPGNDLSFKIDTDNNIEFLKDNKKNNTVFIDYQNRFSPFFFSKLNYKLNAERFVAQVDSVTECKKEFLKEYKHEISNSLKDYIEKDIVYFAAKEKIYYSRRFDRDLIKNNEMYFDFLKSVCIDNNKSVSVLNYLFFIDNYINYLYLDKVFRGKIENKNDYIEKYYIAKSVLKGEALEQFLTENLVLGVGWGVEKEKFNEIVNEFLAGNYSEGAKNIIRRKILAESKLSEGKIAPDFSLRDIKGKHYSLADFKKQYVVLDFWASWCGPCRRAIPKVMKLADKYKDKAQFVFISIDGNQSNWKKANEELLIHEPSLIIDSITRENYGFSNSESVPLYIVLDNKGKIVLSYTTKEEIESLLQE